MLLTLKLPSVRGSTYSLEAVKCESKWVITCRLDHRVLHHRHLEIIPKYSTRSTFHRYKTIYKTCFINNDVIGGSYVFLVKVRCACDLLKSRPFVGHVLIKKDVVQVRCRYRGRIGALQPDKPIRIIKQVKGRLLGGYTAYSRYTFGKILY